MVQICHEIKIKNKTDAVKVLEDWYDVADVVVYIRKDLIGVHGQRDTIEEHRKSLDNKSRKEKIKKKKKSVE